MSIKILIVEDDDSIARALALVFELEGYDVRVAPSPDAAAAAYVEYRPNLVLLDVILRNRSGREFIDIARPTVPVIVMSAAADPVLKGYEEYKILRKPFDLDYMFKMIQSELQKGAQTRPPAA